MTPLRERIVGALQLQPMTQRQIAMCLSVTQQTASQAMNRLAKKGAIRPHGWGKGKRGNAALFEICA